MIVNDKLLIQTHRLLTCAHCSASWFLMRKFSLLFSTAMVVLAVVAYAGWARHRTVTHYLSDLRIDLVQEQGVRGEGGNVLGIQPRMTPADYQDARRLRLKFEAYLRQARVQGLLGPHTVVVLPEHIGTWLWLSGEKDEVYQADRLDAASGWLTLSNPLAFIQAWWQGEGKHRLSEAQLRMKASRMRDDFQWVFGGLARQFQVTLVAGSIVLPNPSAQDGQLALGAGPLYNVGVVFGPDGRVLGQPLRQHQVHYRRFLSQGPSPAVAFISTPGGPLAVAVGDDAWAPAVQARTREQGARALLVPAFSARALNESSPPPGPDLSTRSPAGVLVYLRGRFWSHVGTGEGYSWQAGRHGQSAPAGDGAGMFNLWL